MPLSYKLPTSYIYPVQHLLIYICVCVCVLRARQRTQRMRTSSKD